MIEDIQVVPEKYRRANCKKCKRKIEHLEVRGVIRGGIYDGYLCEKCSKEYLADIPKCLKKMNEKINKLSKMSDEEKREYLKRLGILRELEK